MAGGKQFILVGQDSAPYTCGRPHANANLSQLHSMPDMSFISPCRFQIKQSGDKISKLTGISNIHMLQFNAISAGFQGNTNACLRFYMLERTPLSNLSSLVQIKILLDPFEIPVRCAKDDFYPVQQVDFNTKTTK